MNESYIIEGLGFPRKQGLWSCDESLSQLHFTVAKTLRSENNSKSSGDDADVEKEHFQEINMLQVNDGQCGLCAHFGEHEANSQKLVQVRVNHQAPEDLLEECGHPKHAQLHLQVTAISGCDGFTPASKTVQ